MINTIGILAAYLLFCIIVMGITEFMFHKKMKKWIKNRDSSM